MGKERHVKLRTRNKAQYRFERRALGERGQCVAGRGVAGQRFDCMSSLYLTLDLRRG